MRCKACNIIMSRNDLNSDDELCRYCLSSIMEEFSIHNQLLEDENDVEEDSDGN